MTHPVRDRTWLDYARLIEPGRVLETLIWLPEGHLTQLLDPSADRWRDA
jgi:hypothetical protein